VLEAIGNTGEATAARLACSKTRLAQHRRGARPAQSRVTNLGFGIEAERFAEIIATAIKSATEPLKKRIEALEARPAKGVQFRGVWQRGQSYAEGDFETGYGSLW
jgi:hypothetical protein